MQIALSENKLIAPSKNLKAKCPLCFGNVIAKCGEINIHHWAHKKQEGCDSWSEPETYWHKSWKECFPIQNREVVIQKNEKKHFADIYTTKKIVIELQNSSISSETIREREKFYGNRLLWIINGSKYRDHINITKSEMMRNMNLESNDYWSSWEVFLSNNFINEYLSTNKEFTFSWKYPIRSWENSNRPVFLDIDEQYMLWFFEGIGTSYGKFKVYPKRKFFQKYNGCFTTYQRLNNNDTLNDYKPLVDLLSEIMWDYNREFYTYGYPPTISLKVFNNLTKKTHLSKIRWNELVVPNGNNKGLIFIFCYNNENPKKVGVYIDYTINESIGNRALKLLGKDSDDLNYRIDKSWTSDYIASIPLNKKDLDYLVEIVYKEILLSLKMKVNNSKECVIINYT